MSAIVPVNASFSNNRLMLISIVIAPPNFNTELRSSRPSTFSILDIAKGSADCAYVQRRPRQDDHPNINQAEKASAANAITTVKLDIPHLTEVIDPCVQNKLNLAKMHVAPDAMTNLDANGYKHN